MTAAHLRDVLTIKLFSLSDGKPSQAEFIAVHSSLTLVGFCSWTIVLIWSQRFSIGLRSGDCAGQWLGTTVQLSNLCGFVQTPGETFQCVAMLGVASFSVCGQWVQPPHSHHAQAASLPLSLEQSYGNQTCFFGSWFCLLSSLSFSFVLESWGLPHISFFFSQNIVYTSLAIA